jgi:hypothetical protein
MHSFKLSAAAVVVCLSLATFLTSVSGCVQNVMCISGFSFDPKMCKCVDLCRLQNVKCKENEVCQYGKCVVISWQWREWFCCCCAAEEDEDKRIVNRQWCRSTLLLLLLLIIPVVLTETNSVLSYTEFRSNVVNLVLFVIWAILSVKPTVFCGECNQM